MCAGPPKNASSEVHEGVHIDSRNCPTGKCREIVVLMALCCILQCCLKRKRSGGSTNPISHHPSLPILTEPVLTLGAQKMSFDLLVSDSWICAVQNKL